MNPTTELSLSAKSQRLIEEICNRKTPTAATAVGRDDAGDLSKFNIGFSLKMGAGEEKRVQLIASEMNADDTSPAMRSKFARASLRARGLDLFAAPPGGN